MRSVVDRNVVMRRIPVLTPKVNFCVVPLSHSLGDMLGMNAMPDFISSL
jgi:hypothetical protein